MGILFVWRAVRLMLGATLLLSTMSMTPAFAARTGGQASQADWTQLRHAGFQQLRTHPHLGIFLPSLCILNDSLRTG